MGAGMTICLPRAPACESGAVPYPSSHEHVLRRFEFEVIASHSQIRLADLAFLTHRPSPSPSYPAAQHRTPHSPHPFTRSSNHSLPSSYKTSICFIQKLCAVLLTSSLARVLTSFKRWLSLDSSASGGAAPCSQAERVAAS